MKFQKLVIVLLLLQTQLLPAQKNSLKDFPAGYQPEEIGTLLAYRFVYAKHALHGGKWISYPETFYWKGALEFARLTGNERLFGFLQRRFRILRDKEQQLLPPKNHVDLNMFGSLPLSLWSLTRKKEYLDLGLPYANSQWQVPDNAGSGQKAWAEKGYSWQTRLWIDDMYMITILQTQAYKATRDPQYLDRAAKEMALYLTELQRPNGLFYHAPDVPFYWGRGNGWMAAGITELLRYLPKSHSYYPVIMKGYHKMMESLKDHQRPDGMWGQLIDKADCWAETSGSAMFTYAFITGVKKGWLDSRQYGPAARKAWMAMVSYIDSKGAVSEVCVGTNKKNDLQYYYDRPRHTGDYHGQAPYLWCVNALLEK
ncbi:hypothetical protein GCM10027051_27500 [Niabella terrae]